MSIIKLKTARRKTTISRSAIRKAVAATFVAGSFELKNATVKRIFKSQPAKS